MSKPLLRIERSLSQASRRSRHAARSGVPARPPLPRRDRPARRAHGHWYHRLGSDWQHSRAALGHQVRIANSRGPESLSALAAETGVTASRVEHAARARDVVIVSFPQKAVAELPHGLLTDQQRSSWTPAITTPRTTGASTRSRTTWRQRVGCAGARPGPWLRRSTTLWPRAWILGGAPAVRQAASTSQWPVTIRESARRRSGEEATQIRPTRGLTLDK